MQELVFHRLQVAGANVTGCRFHRCRRGDGRQKGLIKKSAAFIKICFNNKNVHQLNARRLAIYFHTKFEIPVAETHAPSAGLCTKATLGPVPPYSSVWTPKRVHSSFVMEGEIWESPDGQSRKRRGECKSYYMDSCIK